MAPRRQLDPTSLGKLLRYPVTKKGVIVRCERGQPMHRRDRVG